MRVRIFLNRPLFTLTTDGHVPRNIGVILGELTEQGAGGYTITAESYLDEAGRPLEGKPRTLIIPTSKVDHVLVEG